MRKLIIGAVAALLVAVPATAQQRPQTRTLEVPATARWQHSRSGVILPARIGEHQRTTIQDLTTAEVDVGAHYGDDRTRITIYLFRPQIADIGLWFDRADQVIRNNAALGTVSAVETGPTPITVAGGAVPTGLRRSYTGTGAWRTSATALIATGRWIVKFRVSSANADTVAINALLDAAIQSVALPAQAVAGATPIRPLPPGTPIVRVVEPCTDTVRWRNAATVCNRDTGMLGALLMGALAQSANDSSSDDDGDVSGPPLSARPLCRDATQLEGGIAGVYRVAGDDAQYWIAIGDNGAIASVGEDGLAGLVERRRLFSVTLLDPQRTLSFPHYSRLPAPAQAWRMLNSTAPTGMVNHDPEMGSDRTITISPR